jgi:hypothetical protein
VKTQSKEQRAFTLASDDATYILETVGDGVMAQGFGEKLPLDAVVASAERALRASLTDAGLTVNRCDGVSLRVMPFAQHQHVGGALCLSRNSSRRNSVPTVMSSVTSPCGKHSGASRSPFRRS